MDWTIESIPNVIENLDLRPSQSPGIGRSNLAPISNSGDDSIAPIAGAFASVLNQIFSRVGYTDIVLISYLLNYTNLMITTTYNINSLNRLLSGNDEIVAILKTDSSPSSSVRERSWSPSLDGLYYWVSGCVLTFGSYFLQLLCLNNLSKTAWVHSRHAWNQASALKVERIFNSHLLAKSINTHRLDSSQQYLASPQRALSMHTSQGILNLFHPWGICRGMNYWFIYLYFKTRNSFTNVDLQMTALGKQFEQGAPHQAVLLHSLALPSVYDLLKLNVRENECKISTNGKTREQILDYIQSKGPGVYGIYVASHQVVFIKVDATQQYLFDPDVGIIKISSPALLKAAMEGHLASHNSSREILIDHYIPR